MRRVLWIVGGLVVLAAVLLVGDYWGNARPPGLTADYVGGTKCAQCHATQTHRWEGSDHALAMQLATPDTVLGNFDNASFTHFGVTSRMFRQGDKFFVETEGQTPGKLETFQVKFTFGVRPLQQYMVEFPDGRVQVLPLCWDVKDKRWFHIYPDEPIKAGDPLHWTGFAQTWNHMCAECHSTDVHKNYNVAQNTYHTTYNEINVSCEACHGPGSLHVEIAESRHVFWDRNYGYGLPDLKSKDSKVELESCARCHANHGVIHAGFSPGDSYHDYYRLGILDEARYHPDGQILDEVYEFGSFQQSLMYRKGVKCSDCHDPHTTKIKAQGNALCTRCHMAAKYDSPTHHHHPETSTGAKCVECHMPTKTYMVVDVRRDHNFRIPRPDLSDKLKSPNACTGCHRHNDKTNDWAADLIRAWYGPKRRDDPHYGETIQGGREAKATAEAPLVTLAKSPDAGPIVRATAVALLGQYGGANALAAIERACDDKEPLVRAAAVSSLRPRKLKEKAIKLLQDPSRVVRFEAFHQLMYIAGQIGFNEFSPDEKFRLAEARDEYVAGLAVAADTSRTQLELGNVAEVFGDLDRAAVHYAQAIRLVPSDVGARQRLANLALRQREPDEAIKLAQAALKLSQETTAAQQELVDRLKRLDLTEPLRKAGVDLELCLEQEIQSKLFAADVLHNVGNHADEARTLLTEATKQATAQTNAARSAELLTRCGEVWQTLGKLDKAQEALATANECRPYDPVTVLAYAQLLTGQKLYGDAEKLLRECLGKHPQNVAVVRELALLFQKRELWKDAREFAQRWLEMSPDDQEALQTLAIIEQIRSKR